MNDIDLEFYTLFKFKKCIFFFDKSEIYFKNKSRSNEKRQKYCKYCKLLI